MGIFAHKNRTLIRTISSNECSYSRPPIQMSIPVSCLKLVFRNHRHVFLTEEYLRRDIESIPSLDEHCVRAVSSIRCCDVATIHAAVGELDSISDMFYSYEHPSKTATYRSVRLG